MIDWVDYFLDAAINTVKNCMGTTKEITGLKADLEGCIQAKGGSQAKQFLDFLGRLFMHPVVSTASVQKVMGICEESASQNFQFFADLGILVEATGARRGCYEFKQYLDLLEKDIVS